MGSKLPLQMGMDSASEIALSLWRQPLATFPANLGNLQIPQVKPPATPPPPCVGDLV